MASGSDDAAALGKFQIVELPFLFLRHYRNRSRSPHRWDYGSTRALFSVPLATGEEVAAAYRVRAIGRTYRIVTIRDRLFRRAVDATGVPTTIAALEQAVPATLLDDDHEPWIDHCSFVSRALFAPEEPWSNAMLGLNKVRFRSLQETFEDRSRIELQKRLDDCFVVGDQLWVPTDRPGLRAWSPVVPAVPWIPGLKGLGSEYFHFHPFEDASRTSVHFQRLTKQEPGHVEAGNDIQSSWALSQNLEWMLRCMVESANPTVAALGIEPALFFWSGRNALRCSDWEACKSWLEQAPEVFSASGNSALRDRAKLLQSLKAMV